MTDNQPGPSTEPVKPADDPDAFILRQLIASPGGFVSGNDLAGALGITRVGVWARLDKLRAAGFAFTAIRHRGYRLDAQPNRIFPALLRAYLQDSVEERSAPMPETSFFKTIDSTNSEAERQLAQGCPTPHIFIADKQEKGRGRLGRTWHSPQEGNLYMSLAFRPRLTPRLLQKLTLWTGLAICDAIDAFCKVKLQLKWPNDLILNGRKLGGILMEARIDADMTRDVVLGIGLNVNSEPEAWTDDLKPVAISMRQATGSPVNINQFGAFLITSILSAFERYSREDVSDSIRDRWPRRDYLAGKEVSATPGNREITGIAKGIDTDGALIIETAGGRTTAVNAGEVSLGTARMLAG